MTCRFTCIYLSCKVEEFHQDAATLATKLKLSNEYAETALSIEVDVMQGFDFHLKCYHPTKSLYGFVIDLKVTIFDKNLRQDKYKLSNAIVDTIWNSSMEQVWQSFLTDAPFLYSASQIALTAIQTSLKQLKDTAVHINLQQYLKTQFPQLPAVEQLPLLLEKISEQMQKKGNVPTEEEATAILQGLK